uniref:Putative homing endonuclease n=1 Tax=viral metagenome TaxID=1070528 RepID=A0A6M3KCG3_9ZZZZ
MPNLNEVKRADEIGRKANYGSQKYIWLPCATCGKPRWTLFRNGGTPYKRCRDCALNDPATKAKRGVSNSGKNHYKWKGGSKKSDGYIIISLFHSDDFYLPMTDSHRRVREHRLAMAKHLGRCLHSWEFVHHKNGKRDDNRIENLELTTNGNHSIQHSKGYRDGYQKGFADGKDKQIEELRKEIKLIQFQNKRLLEQLRIEL